MPRKKPAKRQARKKAASNQPFSPKKPSRKDQIASLALINQILPLLDKQPDTVVAITCDFLAAMWGYRRG